MLGRSWTAPAAGILLLLVGCSKKDADATSAAPGQAKAKAQPGAAAVADVSGPVTEEGAKKFGADMEAAARAGAPAINRLIDWDSLVDASTGGLGVAEKSRQEFKAGIKSGIDEPGEFAGKLASDVAGGGSYDLLHVHEVGGRRRAMFRQIDWEGMVNYQDYILARGADGKVRAVDFDVFSLGEPLSTSYRRVFIALAAHDLRGSLERLTSFESDLVKSLDKIEAMGQAQANNQPARVLEIFDQLPPSLKKEKVWELGRIRAALMVGDEAKYAAALDEFLANHPGDPGADLVSIDASTIKKQYEKALEGVDRLDKAVGGDPYLDTLRGNIYLEWEKPDKARKAGERSIREAPALAPAYTVVVAATLRTKDYDATVATLRQMKKQFGQVHLEKLSDLQGFDEFSKSPQYEEIKKELDEGSKPSASTAPKPSNAPTPSARD
jgi:hypothetical protein